MITCEDLDGVVEKLCDLTREMSDLERVREATELLDLVDRLPRTFLMQWRAAAAADLRFLHGWTIRDIGPQAGRAFQGVSQWMATHGPSHYLMVRKPAGKPAELKVIKVEGEQTKAKIRHFREAGYRIAPTTFNLLDGENIRPGTDPEHLWRRLTPAEEPAAA